MVREWKGSSTPRKTGATSMQRERLLRTGRGRRQQRNDCEQRTKRMCRVCIEGRKGGNAAAGPQTQQDTDWAAEFT